LISVFIAESFDVELLLLLLLLFVELF